MIQVRIVFQPIARPSSPLPPHLSQILMYAQYFRFAGQQRNANGVLLEETDVDMFLLERHLRSTRLSNGERMRMGDIIPLTDVSHAVEIIPVYGNAGGI